MGVGIPPVHLLHLEIFVGFKMSQNFFFAREINLLFSRQVAMQLVEVLYSSEFAPTLTLLAINS